MAEAAPRGSRAAAAKPSRNRRKPLTRSEGTSAAALLAAPPGGAGTWRDKVLSVIQGPVGLATSRLRSTGGRAQGRAQHESARLDRFIESRIEDVLSRVNIPSRSDIERLNNSVEALTAKVEALVSRQHRGDPR